MVWLERGQQELRAACDYPSLVLAYTPPSPQIAPPGAPAPPPPPGASGQQSVWGGGGSASKAGGRPHRVLLTARAWQPLLLLYPLHKHGIQTGFTPFHDMQHHRSKETEKSTEKSQRSWSFTGTARAKGNFAPVLRECFQWIIEETDALVQLISSSMHHKSHSTNSFSILYQS